MFFNELVRMLWGPQALFVSLPESLSGTVELWGFTYPSYRFLIIAVGLLVAVGSQWLIHRTRVGMLIRAGSVNPAMVGALGVNIRLLNAMLFALGAALAALAGAMAGPILSVQSGMGEPVLITTLVVIVIGGIGSVKGALYAALIVGVADTLGRSYLPLLLRQIADRDVANAAGPVYGLFLIAIGLPKKEFVGTAAWFFLLLNLIKIPFSWNLGLVQKDTLLLNVILLPLIWIGLKLGGRIIHKIGQGWFENLVIVFSILAAIQFLWN
jgi:branched-subunit amino acid ABC-type transport system permease component